MSATLMVRAEVGEADRDAFDRWYQDEHLPDAVRAFDAVAAWRGWSHVEPGLHYAFYELESLEKLQAVMNSTVIKELIAEFDRVWAGRVTRTREVISRSQRIEGAHVA